MYGVTAGDDGTIVGVGRTDGDFFPYSNLGGFDFLVLKLLRSQDAYEYLWNWQVSTNHRARGFSLDVCLV